MITFLGEVQTHCHDKRLTLILKAQVIPRILNEHEGYSKKEIGQQNEKYTWKRVETIAENRIYWKILLLPYVIFNHEEQ